MVQCYENFTGGVLMSLVEHGFSPEQAMDFLKPENLLAPTGSCPQHQRRQSRRVLHAWSRTADQAVRQLRGQSTSQVADVEVSLAAAGPMVTPVSTIILARRPTLMSEFYLPPSLPIPSPSPAACRSRSGTGCATKPSWSSAMRGRSSSIPAAMDLPRYPDLRCGMGRDRTEGRDLQLTRVWHPVHPAMKTAALHRRRGRTAASRTRAHAR